MAELLKDVFNEKFLCGFGQKIYLAYNDFDITGFVNAVMDDTWENLTLKVRIRQITKKLGSFLPGSYKDALEILFKASENCSGFPYLLFPDFVELFGQDEENWELSMKALEYFTPKSSSEYAVRPFLLSSPNRMICQMKEWAKSPNEHVRRLASEGCRPRLPWGVSLPMFKKDPAPVLSVLELLKSDPSLYVRKSVANNLNDIAKDHTDVVLDLARRWQGTSSYTDWIIRKGCRTLVKKADPEVLSLFGYALPINGQNICTLAELSVQPSALNVGDSCVLQYGINIAEGEPVHIRVEYAIDFVKANGHTSRKLFLIFDKVVSGGFSIKASKKHNWADLTTRRHYPGEHRISLLVNGREVAYTVIKLAK